VPTSLGATRVLPGLARDPLDMRTENIEELQSLIKRILPLLNSRS